MDSLAEQNTTFACRITGETPSAIAVIEVVGPDAKRWLDRNWQCNQGDGRLRLNSIRYGHILADSRIGESVIVCRTGQERFEIHCHGGKLAAQEILKSMQDQGIAIQTADQWCLSNLQDLFAAQATSALTQATTLRTARILLDQQQGALGRALARIDSEIQLGELSNATAMADSIRRWNWLGTHLVEPFHLLLCGPPNVGKSSLLNRLLGYQRAIVHEQAGTTRDLLSEISSIDGWPVRLTDSAGIRDTVDPLEAIGVRRAVDAGSSADLQLILVDPIEGWTEEHQHLLDGKPNDSLVVFTKADLQECTNPALAYGSAIHRICCQVSAITGQGIPELLDEISRRLVPEVPPAGQAVLFTESQRQALEVRYQRIGKYKSV